MSAKDFIQRNRSRLTFGLIGFMLCLFFIRNQAWQREDPVRHDMMSYYAYLPAFITYGEAGMEFSDTAIDKEKFSWSFQSKYGRIQRMTMGVALLESPFYLLAEAAALLAGRERDPWSPFYIAFVFAGTLFYCLWGLWYVFQTLRRLFNPGVAISVCLALIFGTNLYFYTFYEALMSHVFNFFLYAALLHFTLKWHNTPGIKLALRIGLCIGFLTLIRPTNALSVLIPLGYDAGNRLKWQLLLRHWPQLLVTASVSVLCFLPQMLYWKAMSGSWLVYSYEQERFFFNDPEIWKGWFSFRKGWFIYTPLMLAIIPGFVLLFRGYRSLVWALLPFFLLFTYVTYSWWCWWYGGSFGSRPMIDTYALAAIPIGIFIRNLSRKKTGKAAAWIFLGFCIVLNLHQTRQYRTTLLHWDSMSWPLYREIFFREGFPENYEELLDPPDTEKALKGE